MDFAKDLQVKEIVIESVTGVEWDISLLMAEFNVYEDIYNSTVSADIVIDDAFNRIKNMPITGHEWLRLKFATPGKALIELRLRIYKISARELEKERRQFYVIHCVDDLQFTNAKVRISKAYKDKTISEIAKSVQSEFLKSEFATLEATKNLFHIIPAYWTPFKTMNFLVSRANSTANKGANYIYFQNANGFHFVSLEKLVDVKPKVKYLFQPANSRDQEAEAGSKPRTMESDSVAIEAYKFESNFDTLENLSNGMYGSRLLWYDIRKKEFGETTFDYDTSYAEYKHVEPNSVVGGSSKLWTSKTDFKSDLGAFKFFPIGQPEQDNHVKDWLLQRISQMQQIQNIRLFVTVPGDSERVAGDLVEISLPSPEPLRDNKQELDSYYTGRYLVSGLRHVVNKREYRTVLELVKDSVFTAYP